MDRSHIGGEEWIKENKKFLYYFEIFVVVFELEKETSKPICDSLREFGWPHSSAGSGGAQREGSSASFVA